MKRRNIVIGLAVVTLAGSFALVKATNVSSGEGSGILPAPPTAAEKDLAAKIEGYVRGLALDVGTRNVRRAGTMAEAVDWLGYELDSLGYDPVYDEWVVDGQRCVNFEITFPGRGLSHETVVVGAHYDSYRKSPCAEATATPTAALLVLLDRLRGHTFERTTSFVFFANGEYPQRGTEDWGAARWATRAKANQDDIVAMLAVGPLGSFSDEPGSQDFIFPWNLTWPGTGDFVAIFGHPRSRKLIKRTVDLWKQGSDIPVVAGAVPSWVPGMQSSDHDAFQAEGFPAVLLSDTGPARFEDIRTVYDQFHRLDYERMARAVLHLEKLVTALVREGP